MLTLGDTGYCTFSEIVNILLHMAIKDQHTALWHSRLCLEELNGISCIYQSCPPAKSKCNNTAEIAISWVMLSVQDRLILGDGFREKGGLYSLLCWNQNFHVGNPMLMKTLSLAGGWCWYPFSTVPRISHTFTLFALLSLAASFFGCVEIHFRWCRLHLVPCLALSTLSFFCSLLLSWSPALTLISLYQHQTPDLVQTFKDSNSLFPTSLSSSHSSTLCLLWDLR